MWHCPDKAALAHSRMRRVLRARRVRVADPRLRSAVLDGLDVAVRAHHAAAEVAHLLLARCTQRALDARIVRQRVVAQPRRRDVLEALERPEQRCDVLNVVGCREPTGRVGIV